MCIPFTVALEHIEHPMSSENNLKWLVYSDVLLLCTLSVIVHVAIATMILNACVYEEPIIHVYILLLHEGPWCLSKG